MLYRNVFAEYLLRHIPFFAKKLITGKSVCAGTGNEHDNQQGLLNPLVHTGG